MEWKSTIVGRLSTLAEYSEPQYYLVVSVWLILEQLSNLISAATTKSTSTVCWTVMNLICTATRHSDRVLEESRRSMTTSSIQLLKLYQRRSTWEAIRSMICWIQTNHFCSIRMCRVLSCITIWMPSILKVRLFNKNVLIALLRGMKNYLQIRRSRSIKKWTQ